MAEIFETPMQLLESNSTVTFARSSRGILNSKAVGDEVVMEVQGFTFSERRTPTGKEERAMLALENGVLLSVTEHVFNAITKGSKVTMCVRDFTPDRPLTWKEGDKEPTPIKYFEYVSHKVNTTAKKVEIVAQVGESATI